MSTSNPDPRRIRRREAIAGLGAIGAGGAYALWRATQGNGSELAERAHLAARADQCVLQPELTEGPYYLDAAIFRRNVTEGRPGEVLELRFRVQDSESCEPIKNATVEIWHADADGGYSGFDDPSNSTYLRGQQKSDKDGKVEFRTVYPGWYSGRTPHIHIKVHVNGNTVHTGQLFFDEGTTAKVYSEGIYAANGAQDTTNASDSIFAGSGGKSTLKLSRRRNKKGRKIDGYLGKLKLGVTRA
jgi:protocatechuate 3,4-dioxygenase beta subunit